MRYLMLATAILLVVGCGDDGGSAIDRPDDQAFSGGDGRGGEAPPLTLLITDVTLRGSFDEPATVTVNGAPDEDPDSLAYATRLDLDDVELGADPGAGGGELAENLSLVAEDGLGNTTGVSVEFIINP